MDIEELIRRPELLDRETLYELRSMLALYPYFQTARLLMLQNLYLLHDPTFDQELRRAAIYITDRKVLFQMIEAGHYQLKTLREKTEQRLSAQEQDSRTLSLIDNFLESIPQEEQHAGQARRRPTPADAAVDYVAYLMESQGDTDEGADGQVPQLIGHSLIDTFIENEGGKIVLSDNPVLRPETEDEPEEEKTDGDGYFTETLARIYIKQGRYSQAIEIIRQLSLDYPKKSAYFADQIRFLEKLIINNNKK